MANCTYECLYNGKRETIEATTLWDAQQKAVAQMKVPKSKQGLLSVVLVKVDDREIVHSTGGI
jgi:hypothetical protein